MLGSAPRWGWSWGQGMIWEPLAWCWSPWAAAELGSVPNASGVPDAGGVPKLSALGGGARAPCSHPELTDAGCIGWATLTPTFLQKRLCGSAQNTADCFFGGVTTPFFLHPLHAWPHSRGGDSSSARLIHHSAAEPCNPHGSLFIFFLIVAYLGIFTPPTPTQSRLRLTMEH